MRLKLFLPTVVPRRTPAPGTCPRSGCGRRILVPFSGPKPLRDTQLDRGTAWRYRCVRCAPTFRVYPPGVSSPHTSARLVGVEVIACVVGPSNLTVELALEALGHPHDRERCLLLTYKPLAFRRRAVRLPTGQLLVGALCADLTSVKCHVP